MLKIKNNIQEQMITHSKDGFPLEVCGYLAEKDGIISSIYKLTNTDKSNDHFTMDPAEQFATIKEMRIKGERQVVVYHSHPESPSRPSDEDKKLAYDSEVSYIIVSLAESIPVVKSFKIVDGVSTEEEIQIID